MKRALLVIDVQRDFSEPDGKLPVCRAQADQIIGVINTLTERFSSQNLDVIYIVHEWSNRLIQFLVRNAAAKGTPGAERDRRLMVAGNLKFTKFSASAFTNEEFSEYLRSKGIRHLYVTGLAAEHCVNATIEGAIRDGYAVTAVSDGIAAKRCKNLERSLAGYARKGAAVLPSSEVLSSFGY